MDFDITLLSIPVVSGLIGYATNYVGIKLLFYPVRFIGREVPGLAACGVTPPKDCGTRSTTACRPSSPRSCGR